MATTSATPPPIDQRPKTKSTIGFGGGISPSSEDQQHVKQVEGIHAPDDTLNVDVGRLLHLVQDILTNATAQTNTAEDATDQAKKHESLDSKMVLSGFEDMPDIPIIIERLSCEVSCKSSVGPPDAHALTLSVFKTISGFNWDAKLVLTLAAFALSYGELWLLAQTYPTNRLAKSMVLFKQVPKITEQDDSLKRPFEAVNNLINAMLDVAEMVVEFNELPSKYLSQGEPAAAMKLSVYWTVRSAVSAAIQITALTSYGHEHLPSINEMELSNWTDKLTAICERLGEIKYEIIMRIEYEKIKSSKIKKAVKTGIDIMTVLKMLIRGKDDTLVPLYDCYHDERVQLDIFREKTVLLLISSLDIPIEAVRALGNIHTESETRAYEIIWVPIIVDPTISWNDALQDKFESLRATMPWYSVHHLSIIDGAVIRFFREDLKFTGEPILAGLDTKGKLINRNAMPMMWIWGTEAFPFTTAWEETLWEKADWKLDLLVIDDTVRNWMKEDKYIFLFGGDDIDWVTKSTREARAVAEKSKIGSLVELLYVGRSCKKVDGLKKVISTIEKEKLCTHVFDTSNIWLFWTRLQSMLDTKIQLNKVNEVSNIVTSEIKKLISYDKQAFGTWALFARGSKVVLSGPGSTIYKTLVEFYRWEKDIPVDGFAGAISNYHHRIYLRENPSCRFEFRNGTGKIPERMKCPVCRSYMVDYTIFICCHEGAAAVTGAHDSIESHLPPRFLKVKKLPKMPESGPIR